MTNEASGIRETMIAIYTRPDGVICESTVSGRPVLLRVDEKLLSSADDEEPAQG